MKRRTVFCNFAQCVSARGLLGNLIVLPFLAILLAILSAGACYSQEQKKIALLVGVSDYFDKDMPDLAYAENDVNAIGAELKKIGFQTTILIGAAASRGKVNSALDSFMSVAEKLKSTDIVFVMFSGHGQQLPTTRLVGDKPIQDEKPFFCPYDTVPIQADSDTNTDKLLDGLNEAQVAEKLNLVSLSQIISDFDRRSNSERNLLIVDACRSNPAKGKFAGVTGSTVTSLPRGISILFAAKSGQKSWEYADDTIQHGVFSHFLLKGLKGAAVNPRNELTWMRLVTHIKEEVPAEGWRIAGGKDRVQNPHAIINDDDNIVLCVTSKQPKPKPNSLSAPFTAGKASESQAAWAEYNGVNVETINAVDMTMLLIPPGEFQMGNEDSVDKLIEVFPYAKKEWLTDAVDRHLVKLTKPFFMGKTEVTLAQFKEFVRDANYKTEAEADGKGGYGYVKNSEGAYEYKQDPKFTYLDPGFSQNDQHPVVNVSWNDAVSFCNWLSRKEGLPEYYRIGISSVGVRGGKGYRLPTEAEWEYACRAGTTTRFQHGSDAEGMARISNISDATGKTKYNWGDGPIAASDGHASTAPVGTFTANRFGLYDMHGNVWEWCQDLYDAAYYKNSPSVDPPGPIAGSSRVLRGGSWYDLAVYCRSAYRSNYDPANRDNVIGFRIVCEIE